jgi:membrane fusion protein, multidrug efflux system
LQIGLSMKVEVSIRDGRGARLPQLAQSAPAYSTDVFHSVDAAADSRVQEIIAANDSVAAKNYGSVKQAAGKLASLD